MIGALYFLYIVNCFFLIGVVLLQAGRGGGMSLMGGAGGGGSATVFGIRGAATFVQKATVYSAVGFMSLSMLIAYKSMAPNATDRGVILSDEELAEMESSISAGGDTPGTTSGDSAEDEGTQPATEETGEE